jgi:hypothetical protein
MGRQNKNVYCKINKIIRKSQYYIELFHENIFKQEIKFIKLRFSLHY